MQNKINLLFPVEITSRELDFRIFLACLAAREDRRVWVGQQRVIYALGNCMQGGLYLGKNIFGLPPKITWNRYHNLKQRGFRFIHLDEEGAVYRGGPDKWMQELARRFDPTQMEREDYVCTWGDFQREFYQSFNPPCHDNIRTTGHPRFDLYKLKYRKYFEPEAARLRERYGDFILINSNLHRVNNHSGTKRVFSERLGYYVKDNEKRTQFFDRWQHLNYTFTNFVCLINRLSVEFPDLNIVVRPHPSENKSFYNTVFDGVPNVHAVREGSVSPWLLACRVMIHDGCTTGLEASLADVPVINYKPVEDPQHDAFLPNLFGTRCAKNDGVVQQVQNILHRSEHLPSQKASNIIDALPEQAYQLLDNLRHDSFAQLLNVIGEATSSLSADKSHYRSLRYTIQETMRHYGLGIKRKVLRPRGGPERLDKFHSFKGLGMEERLELAQQVTGTKVHHVLHSPDLMSLEAA